MGLSKNRLANPTFTILDAAMPVSSFADSTLVQTARSWFVESYAAGGTPIALTVSQVPFPPTQNYIVGEPQNYLQLAFTSAGSGLGSGSYLKLLTRLAPTVLNGLYATFSFWMSSAVATSPATVVVRRSYGTGGPTPSPDDVFKVTGAVAATGPAQIKAVAGWQRYSVTVPILPTNNPEYPKVFGTNSDAFIEIAIYLQADAALGLPGGAVVPPATNTILIAQPQLEAGTTASGWEDGDPAVPRSDGNGDVQVFDSVSSTWRTVTAPAGVLSVQ